MENENNIFNTSDHHHVKDGIIDLVAGSLAGIATVYVGQPLDTVKVKMQTFPTMYTNMFQCFTKTVRTDGISKGLYAGTAPALAANIVENSILFCCYGFCQKIIQVVTNADSVDNLSILSNASAGFIASFFTSIAITPTELVKCKLQAMHEWRRQELMAGRPREAVGPIKLTSQIIKREGIPGLFRGLIPTLAREMPGYFCFFGGYEGTRELLRQPHQRKEDIGLLKTMVSGAIGGCIFWTVCFPVDVAKSRIQVENIQENMFVLIYKIFRQEGFVKLYNGLTPTLVRTVPATAALFATYEYSKQWMHNYF